MSDICFCYELSCEDCFFCYEVSGQNLLEGESSVEFEKLTNIRE